MISGSNEKELDIANQIADLLLEKEKLQQENKQLNRKIDTLAFWINETINAIEEQSTGNDEYILTRLYSFISILGDKE